MRKAVIYARVSSDDSTKDGRNLESQFEMGRHHAEMRGYTVVSELAEDDRGASGAEVDLPQLNTALDMAALGEYEVFIVRELDRLSRNLAKQLTVEQALSRYGVSIEYCLYDFPDTPEGRLNKHLRAMLAEYERDKIRERNMRGRRNVVKRGSIMLHGCHPPFGYALSEDGRNLVPDDPEAKIVRSIYEWYVSGDEYGHRLSTQKIAERLTDAGMPTWADQRGTWRKRRGYGQWSPSSVLKILHSEAYAGTWHYGKKRQPHENWIALAVPALVPPELWEAAQKQAVQNQIMSGRNGKYEYLMRYRLRCRHCGHSVGTLTAVEGDRTYPYYPCGGRVGHRLAHGVVCEMPYFRAAAVDQAVWQWVRGNLLSREALESGLAQQQAARQSTIAPLERELTDAQSRRTDHRTRLERLVDLYLDNGIDRSLLDKKRSALEGAIADEESRIRELKASIAQHGTDRDQILSLTQFAEQIGARIRSAESVSRFAERREIIERLDVQGQIGVEGDDKVVYVTCALTPEPLAIALTSSATPRF